MSYTKYFRTTEDVERFFEVNLSPREAEHVQAYLDNGISPNPAGCWHCTESEMLKFTAWIRFYETMVDDGVAQDPRERDTYARSYGLPTGGDWG